MTARKLRAQVADDAEWIIDPDGDIGTESDEDDDFGEDEDPNDYDDADDPETADLDGL